MTEPIHLTTAHQPELPNILKILDEKTHSAFFHNIYLWENVVFSLFIIAILLTITYFATRKMKLIPSGLQNAVEATVESVDNFVCGIMGPKGRKFTPFIGTLFLYILLMNLSGLIPFFKSSTTSWSTTLALALCVFVYVQYVALKEHGFLGYMYHLAGKPKGAMAFTIVLPLFMFTMHILTELIRPLSLSLRLRSVMWGDEILIAVLKSFHLVGLPLLILNMLMAALTAVVQAFVFSLLTTIYFVLVLEDHD